LFSEQAGRLVLKLLFRQVTIKPLQNHTKSPYSNHQVTNRSAFQSKVKPNEPIDQSGASSHLGQNTDAEKFTKGQSETLMGVDQETNF
jgi:hypothetical protein